MNKLTFDIDYSHCPKGHSWVFIPSSTLYPDVWWCKECGCFYEPSVKKVSAEYIDKEYSNGRSNSLVRVAEFRKWKEGLTRIDFNIWKDEVNKRVKSNL